jgi:hypothetical protein
MPLALVFVPCVKSVPDRRLKALESDIISRGSLEQNIASGISLKSNQTSIIIIIINYI